MSEQDEDLTRLTEAILEGELIDWEAELSRRPDLRPGLERLRRIEPVLQVQAGGGDPDTSFGIPILNVPVSPETSAIDPGFLVRAASASTHGVTGTAAASAAAATASAAGGAVSRPIHPLPFERWGDLELRDLIAVGGYSEVYRAWDPGLAREVALKLMRADRPIGAVEQERYLAEARRLARVRHDNVLVVYGADVHHDRLGLWTELIEGETYEDILREKGPLGPSEAGLVGVRVCRALAAVHAAGILHRDVKAANVMRARAGRTVLLDFGAGAEISPEQSGILPEGGTPLVMAPEQLNGRPATRASDVYSVGALLYRLLTGRHPIDATTIEELRERATRGDWTPLRDLRPDASGQCVRAVERALSPDPANRFASVGALEGALQGVLTELNIRIQDAPRESAVPWRALAIGAAVLAGLALVSELVPWRNVPPPLLSTSSTGSAVTVPSPLDVRAIFVRERDGQGIFTLDGDVIVPEDGLTVEILGSDSMHVYVVERNTAGAAFLLFPAPDLDRRNPLAGGTSHRLPGSRRGRAHQWSLTGRPGEATLIAYASRTPIPDLEAARLKADATGSAELVTDQPIADRTLEHVDKAVRLGPSAAKIRSATPSEAEGEAIWSDRIRVRLRGREGS
ncbi:MAG: protein kinase domain-containing protein [Candidatus Eiseniibacteriota bacterium]